MGMDYLFSDKRHLLSVMLAAVMNEAIVLQSVP